MTSPSAARPAVDVVIVGGGIIGLAVAWELARRQRRVALYEARKLGGAASHAAAGMLAPLVEAETLDDFFTSCRQSRDLWQTWAHDLSEISGLDLDYDRSGALVVDAGGPQALDGLRRLAAAAHEPCSTLQGSELRSWIPDLAPELEVGLHLPGEHRINNRRVCEALRTACRGQGVELHEHHPVRQVRRQGNGWQLSGDGWTRSAPQAVVAAGPWTARLDGLPALPVTPVRGQMIELSDVHWPWTGSLRAGEHYAVRRQKGRLLVGATVEALAADCLHGDGAVSTAAAHTTLGGQLDVLGACRALFPRLAAQPLHAAWAGLRPATPDRRPALGWIDDNLCIATGHFRNGILLAPWTGRRVAQGLCGQLSMPEAFSPRRWRIGAEQKVARRA